MSLSVEHKLKRLRWFYAFHWGCDEDTIQIQCGCDGHCFSVSPRGSTMPEHYDFVEESENGLLTSNHQGNIVAEVIRPLFTLSKATLPKLYSAASFRSKGRFLS